MVSQSPIDFPGAFSGVAEATCFFSASISFAIESSFSFTSCSAAIARQGIRKAANKAAANRDFPLRLMNSLLLVPLEKVWFWNGYVSKFVPLFSMAKKRIVIQVVARHCRGGGIADDVTFRFFSADSGNGQGKYCFLDQTGYRLLPACFPMVTKC